MTVVLCMMCFFSVMQYGTDAELKQNVFNNFDFGFVHSLENTNVAIPLKDDSHKEWISDHGTDSNEYDYESSQSATECLDHDDGPGHVSNPEIDALSDVNSV